MARRQWLRQAATMMGVVAVSGLVACTSSSDRPSSSDVPGTGDGTAPAPTAPFTSDTIPTDSTDIAGGASDLVASGATLFTVDGGVDWLAIAGGGVWGAGATLVKLDASTGEQIAGVAVSGVCLAMDVGFDSLWVADCGNGDVVRVDPTDGSVIATIAVGAAALQEEGSLAAGEGGVFVVSRDGSTITRIDPATNEVAGNFPAPAGSTAVRAGFGSLWVTQFGAGTVARLDPSTGEVLATVAVGEGPRFLTVGPDAVWVLDQQAGQVTRVDPVTNAAVATVQVDSGPVEGGDIAAGGGYVWARVTATIVARIDPQTNEVVASYGPAAGSGSVAATDGVVWISAHDSNSVWRFPLET